MNPSRITPASSAPTGTSRQSRPAATASRTGADAATRPAASTPAGGGDVVGFQVRIGLLRQAGGGREAQPAQRSDELVPPDQPGGLGLSVLLGGRLRQRQRRGSGWADRRLEVEAQSEPARVEALLERAGLGGRVVGPG